MTTSTSTTRDTTLEVAARTIDLVKVYGSGSTRVEALRGVSVDFPRGGFTAVMGPSGSGKSTLLHCLAALDTPTSGSVLIGETDVAELGEKQRTALRRDRIGFVFQAFNLVPTLPASENITLPARLGKRALDQPFLDRVIDTLGLRPRLDHRPSELSGGQQQRVAVARALAGRPEIVFADEPTGNLDSRASAELLGFLSSSAVEGGQTIVMVTHDPVAAAYADRVLFLSDGAMVDELHDPSSEDILARLMTLESGTSERQA
jgi:putative ABC transport system ATP-binding protein